jgi:hypothetical protein
MSDKSKKIVTYGWKSGKGTEDPKKFVKGVQVPKKANTNADDPKKGGGKNGKKRKTWKERVEKGDIEGKQAKKCIDSNTKVSPMYKFYTTGFRFIQLGRFPWSSN